MVSLEDSFEAQTHPEIGTLPALENSVKEDIWPHRLTITPSLT